MGIKETLEIIIKAQDKASQTMSKLQNNIKKVGTTSKSTNTSMNQLGTATRYSMNQAVASTMKASNSMRQFGNTSKSVCGNGIQSWNSLSNAQQKSLMSLSTGTNTTFGKVKAGYSNLSAKIRNETRSISQNFKQMSTSAKLAFGGSLALMGQQINMFGMECLESARTSNRGWIAYKNSFDLVSKGSHKSLDMMKKDVFDLANSTARSVAETRDSMNRFMMKGFSYAQAMKGAYASSGIVASGLAKTEEQASQMIIQSLSGRGMALKKLGIDINNYKDKVTGQIDTDRLLNDITNKTKNAQESYAKSEEGNIQRLDNVMSKFKSTIGQGMVEAISPLLPYITEIVKGFTNLAPQIKGVVGAIVLLVMGLTSLAPAFYSLKVLKDLFGKNKEAVELLGKSANETGKFTSLKNGLNSLKSYLGDLGGKIRGFGSSLSNIGSKINLSNIKTQLGSLKTVLMDTGGKAKELASSLLTAGKNALISGYNALKSAGMWLIQKAQLIATSIANGIVTASQWLLNIAMSANPIGIVILAIAGLVAILIALYTQCEPVRNIINEIGAIIQNGLIVALNFLGGCLQNTINFFQWLYNTIINLPNSISSMVIAFGEFLGQLPGLVWNYLVIVGTIIINTGASWINNARNIAYRVLIGIISFISGIPGRVWSFLVSVATKIINAGVNWFNNAKIGGKKIVDGVMEYVKSLPGKIGAEFLKIPARITGAIGSAVNSAKNFGKSILNSALGVLGIHSPGIIQNSVANEFESLENRITSSLPQTLSSVKDFGSKLVNTAKNDMDIGSAVNLTPNLSNTTPNLSNTTPETTPNLSNTTPETTPTVPNESIDPALQDLNKVNNETQANLDNILNNVSNTLNMIKSKVNISFNTNAIYIGSKMMNILHTLTTSTKNIVSSFNVMKNGVVNTAKSMQSQTSSWINKLSHNIGNFYGKLQNPSRWGAGAGGTSSNRGSRRLPRVNFNNNGVGGSNLKNFIKSYMNSKTIGLNLDFLKYTGSKMDNKTLDLILNTNQAKSGAFNFSSPHISKIKGVVRKQSAKAPKLAGRVNSGLKFRVSDFENGKPKIGMGDFTNMAYALVQSTRYPPHMYFDSERYGNWINALNHGEMNCSDGSDMLIALARLCGLSASKVHCFWGNIGHFVARIGGRIFDSVSMRHGSLTSPKVHGYGAGGGAFKFPSNKNDNSTDNIIFGGEITVVHDLKNVPSGLSEREIAELINNSTTDNEAWIKSLVNSRTFQNVDRRVKARYMGRDNRSAGL